jgi:glutamyl-tRNA synthetase
LKRVVKTPAKFDRAKLLAFNCDAITGMPREEFVARARLHGQEFHADFMAKITGAQFDQLAGASHERSKTLDEMFRTNRFFIIADEALTWERSKNVEKALLGPEPNGLGHLKAVLPVLAACADWSAAALEQAITPYATQHTEGNLGKVAQPLRIAVSGGTVSPPIFDTLAILGRQSTLARIQGCIASFGG